ncbi:MAG: ABC-F family ATP-binding cassette domain-containing protein, partial [Rikenellaceae bacterium]|nr:ABC-F family ATP-binding cassette domain-containing protein [Rikenellaceae bacterium]
FSGGWRMRIELAKLLLRKPSILLLDEPTNHLDIESIQWLESYLKDYSGAVLLISHDRAFLDNVTTRTIELSCGKSYDYKVPYSHYVQLRAERREQQMAAFANQQRMIEKSEEFIERFRYKPTKSNQVQSRIKQLEKIERIEIDDEDTSTLNIKFPPAPRSGQIVAEIKEVGKSFGSHRVFGGANITIERGEKIAFVGRNGEGKTTLARMIIGETDATEGTIRLGANVNVGYYAQNQDDLMNGEFTVFDTLDKVAVGEIRTRLRDILGAFLFHGEDIDKKVKVLSGGERSRLAMARMMLEPRNLLVLDEPTNHMDMRSKDILKNALKKYDGTLILVSHDRDFLDGIVDKVYEFRDGGVKEYLGGIYYFLEKRQLESLREVEIKQKEVAAEPAVASKGKEEYLQRKENEKEIRRIKNAITKVESEIERLEGEIADWDAKLADPEAHGLDISNPALFDSYNQLKQQLDHQMHEWEKLNYELDIVTN